MAEGIQIGSTFAGYRVESVLGRGGMGVVFRAEQPRLGRMVAIKVIAPELASDDTFRERFSHEARLAAAIEHPNAIPIYEAGMEGKTPYLVMRFVDGVDLSSVIKRDGSLSADRAVTIIEQVAGALDEAHHRGLVHRDVKPANVLVEDRRGREHAYLTDFGLTKQAGSLSGVTATGRWVGTIDYAAPEQIRGKRVDARADVYSLGCLLFAILTGRLPFERDAEVAKLYAHINDPPPLVGSYGADLPRELDWVVNRALAKDPDDRFQSAGDLGRAAHAAVHGQPVSKAERTVATGAAAPDESIEAADVAAPTPPPGAVLPPTDAAAYGPEVVPPSTATPSPPPTEPGPSPTEAYSAPPSWAVPPTVASDSPGSGAVDSALSGTAAEQTTEAGAQGSPSEGSGATVAMPGALSGSQAPGSGGGGSAGGGSTGANADGDLDREDDGDGPTPSRIGASPGEAATKVRSSPREKRSKIGLLLLLAVIVVGAIIAYGNSGGGSDEPTTTTQAPKKSASAPKTFDQPAFSVKVPSQFEVTDKELTEDQGTSVGTELDADGVKLQVVQEKTLTDPDDLIATADSKNTIKAQDGTIEGFQFYNLLSNNPTNQVDSEGPSAERYEYQVGDDEASADSVVTFAFNRGGSTWRTRVQVDGTSANQAARADEISKLMAVSLKPKQVKGGPE
ncbi:hypothetical protein BH10ACT11_BH10ACT11_07750 [soil metagenome]